MRKVKMAQDFGWRRFNFFDKNVVVDKNNAKEKFLGLKDINVDCWCTSGNSVYLGESKGGVFRLTSYLDEYYWKAYQKSLASIHSAGKYLFSIGEDDETVNSILKIWDPDTIEKNTPVIRRSVRMSPLLAISSCPASSVAVHSSLSAIAVGFADGAVLFYQGDVIHDKNLNSKWLRIRNPNPSEGSVTGIAIGFLPGGKTVVFVITIKHVFSYVIENKSVVCENRHEANGASSDCWTFDENMGQLVVASREMVYFYDCDQCLDADGGVGRCLHLGKAQEKLQLVSCGQYLALMTKQNSIIQKAEFMTMMTVYDIKGQYIAFSCSLPSLCRLFVITNTMYILSSDGSLSDLTEKNLNSKLDILFKKNLYDVAVGIAKHSKDGNDHLKAIHAKYADYLYSKGDFENSINQYKETIGTLETSYVIKKYLGGSKLAQLCVYLEHLHDAGKENTHHTNILLNAYAKRGEKKKLMQFVNKMADSSRRIDVNEIFKILVEWNYLPEASLLATKFDMHKEALSVIIEKMNNYPMAVKYIAKRPLQDAVEHLEQFGRILLKNQRDETISLVLDVVSRIDNELYDLSKLFDIFVGDREAAEEFLQFVIQKVNNLTNPKLTNIMLEIRLRAYDSTKDDASETLIPLINESNQLKALYLAQLFECDPVVEYILKKSKKSTELLNYYEKTSNLAAIIELCKEFDKEDLWLKALSICAKSDLAENEGIVIKLLEEIEQRQVVQPLVVLDILSKSNHLTISTVKNYVINWLQNQENKILTDKKTIDDNEKQLKDLDEHIESLRFNAQVLQVSKCSACDTGLELPTVHFLCKHSFHVHCFESYSEGADKCPACSIVHKEQDQENLTDRGAYSKFQKELADCSNTLELISKYLEKGIFDNKSLSARKTDATKNAVAALLGVNRAPSDEEDMNSISRSMSTASSLKPSERKMQVPTNPFDEEDDDYDNSKNPFGASTPTSNNPFFE